VRRKRDEYFGTRASDLLVLNLRDPLAMRKLCDFLDVEYVGQTMPRRNSSGSAFPEAAGQGHAR